MQQTDNHCSTKLRFGVITPFLKPISPLIGLNVEPGGYEAINALLNKGFNVSAEVLQNSLT